MGELLGLDHHVVVIWGSHSVPGNVCMSIDVRTVRGHRGVQFELYGSHHFTEEQQDKDKEINLQIIKARRCLMRLQNKDIDAWDKYIARHLLVSSATAVYCSASSPIFKPG